jgi:microsomal dipeptidase-like Zn-dependent dipeptidase
MEYDFNIDIHCHSSWKPFMSGRNNPAHTPFESYENEISARLLKRLSKQIESILRFKLSTQSNFDNLHKGNVRLAIVSLTPLEKAFFVANVKSDGFLKKLIKLLVTEEHERKLYTLKNNVINALTGFHTTDINFAKKWMSQYFQEALVPEYTYFTKFNNQQNNEQTYSIKFVKNFQEIKDCLHASSTTICIIISIEGAHTLSSQVPESDHLMQHVGANHLQDELDFDSLLAYQNNIEAMKKWEFVPLYISLNHHFWNGLGGHAKSLTKLFDLLVSQTEGMNEGLKGMGKEVIRLLLKTTNGPRVLIDIKHMSPACRKDFYSFIQTDYWMHNDKFPLICSHTGVVSKSKTLDALIIQDDKMEWQDNSNYLHEQSINLCAEDILIIAETGGLIGIQLDEQRIAGNIAIEVVKKNRKLSSEDVRKQYVKILFANLFEIVKTVNTKNGWNLLSIGSDYDGFIHHLDFYPTTAEIPVLKKDMLDFLIQPEDISPIGFDYSLPLHEMHRLMFGLAAEEIIQKIFATNVMNFLEKNFNRL